jgi:two-component system chemotaxis response regulator CheY
VNRRFVTILALSWPVLIVEDDDDIRDALVGILVARGYRALAATNGQHAIDITRRFIIRPAVIVLDLMMPVMDGASFLAIRHKEPMLDYASVVVMTAQPDLVRTLPDVPFATLTKPVGLQELLDCVRRGCDAAARTLPEHGR